MKAHVTFEFEEKQPLTSIHEVEATNPATAMARAVRRAVIEQKGKNRGWTSIVCLLERHDEVVSSNDAGITETEKSE